MIDKSAARKAKPSSANQLFLGVASSPWRTRPKSASEPGAVTSPVGRFVGEGGSVAFCIPEGLEKAHLHIVLTDGVVGHCAPMPDIGTDTGEEAIGVGDAIGWVRAGARPEL